jgi:hypothetical protein
MCAPAAKAPRIKVAKSTLDSRVNPIPEPTLTRVTGSSVEQRKQLAARRAGIQQLGSFSEQR